MFKLNISWNGLKLPIFLLLFDLNIRSVLNVQGQIIACSKPLHLTEMIAVEKFGQNQPVEKNGRFWPKIAKNRINHIFVPKSAKVSSQFVLTELFDRG